jgi:N-acetylneuraminic acid mutarotase
MAVAAVGLDVYAIGGQTASGIDNSVAIFDTQDRTWRAGAPKLTAVANAAAGVLAGEIYVVGGRGENEQATTAVEAYSPLNDGWRPVTPLPRPVAGGVALTSGGLLYLFGGQDGDAVLDSAFVFSPATQQWQTLPALQQARAFASGGVLGGKLYVVGGSDGTRALASCEVFDPAANAWSGCPDMIQPRAGAGAAVLLNKLYVLGGGLHGDVSSGEVYDANGESWSDVPVPMLEETPGWPHLGVASVETHIYALGGLREGALSEATYVYRPLVYQFFIPAASSGEGD